MFWASTSSRRTLWFIFSSSCVRSRTFHSRTCFSTRRVPSHLSFKPWSWRMMLERMFRVVSGKSWMSFEKSFSVMERALTGVRATTLAVCFAAPVKTAISPKKLPGPSSARVFSSEAASARRTCTRPSASR